jgi:hypothetical protein
MLEMAHRLHAVPSDLGREYRPEPVPPKPNRFMGNVDPALMQQVLDVAQ